jgi:hypothetical protein
MKTKIMLFCLISLMFYINSLSQNRWNQINTNLPSVYRNTLDVQFPSSADNGYALFQTNGGAKGYLSKSTNKGLDWSVIKILASYFDVTPSMYFINSTTGWLCDPETIYGPGYLYRTTDGGSTNFILVNHDHTWRDSKIFFVNENTGYLFNKDEANIFKTTDAGYNLSAINYGSTSYNLNDLAFSSNNSNVVYVGGYKAGTNFPFLMKSTTGFENGQYTIIFNEINYPFNQPIQQVVIANNNGNDVVYLTTNQGLYQLINDNSVNSINLYGSGLTCFLDASTVLHYYPYASDSHIDGSSNGGQTFTNELDVGNGFNSYLRKISSVGQTACIMYTLEGNATYFAYRKLNMNLRALYELQPDQGQITVNSGDATHTFDIPSSQYIMGGTSYLTVPSSFNNKVFYKWSDNNSMNKENHSYYFDHEGDMLNPYYKGHLNSTDINAIGPAQQAKAIKDTVLNNINTIHLVTESMGGIFYTKSNDNGNTFQPEEVVNYTATSNEADNNRNASIAVIRSAGSLIPLTTQYPEKNVVCVWERFNSSTGKDEIKVSKRGADIFNNYGWYRDYTSGPNYLTTFTASSNFQSKPKIFCATFGLYDGDYIYVVPHLEPYGNNQTKIVVSVRYYTQYQDYEIDHGNISGLAVTAPFNMYSVFGLHFAYLKDNQILYKYTEIGKDVNTGQLHQWVYSYLDKFINDDEVQNYRFAPDITLRNASNDPNSPNMQPVVTYQGQYRTRIIIGSGGTDNTDNQYTDGTYYPIIIRERNASGVWPPTIIQYNSLAHQQNPNIEGSKTRDSYIINYSQSNTTFYQKVPKWETHSPTPFHCYPEIYSGKDSKFVRGGLANQYSTDQALMTLTASGNIFQVAKQPFSITNERGADDDYDGVNGIVISDNMKYSFDLGSVMVNSNLIYFDGYIDSTISDIPDLNDNMNSRPFYLNSNDTLVLGRDAYYLPSDTGSTFAGIEYWVDLVNNTTDIVQQNLIHDTIHVNDTVHLDYLDGFVITNIPSDSFYVQLRIDTLFTPVSVGGGSISGGFGGGSGSNKPLQKKIFWHDGRKEVVNFVPTVFNLYQNFPNPFNPATVIKYDLPKDVNVSIKIYDLLGREVAILANSEFKKAGRYELNWNASNYASGVYIYRIEARQVGSSTGDFVQSKKMVLIK